MRGYVDYNFPAFDQQAQLLREHGWVVINPAELDRQNGGPHQDPFQFDPNTDDVDQQFMREALSRDLTALCEQCTAIYMLTGWESSRGARAELATAIALGIDIHYETPNINP
jgi:hypothetical protein